MNHASAAPGPVGLYDPTNEHDACGVALVAKLWGEATHAVIEKGLEALGNLEHRGAAGADPNTGDGAGILLQIPDAFFRGAVAGVELPPPGRYAVGVIFLPTEPERRAQLEQLIERTVEAEGQRVVWWRDVPTDDRYAGDTARASQPFIRQVLVAASDDVADQDAFERRLYVIRRLIELEAGSALAIPSFSSRTTRLQGHAHRAAAAALLHRPARPAAGQPSGARALAFQHQHLPQLDTRAPVPHGRPQRRDQHAAGQRQLDARP